MPQIGSLVTDIYKLLDSPNADMEFDISKEAALGGRLIRHIRDEIRDPDRSNRPTNELYVTQFTSPCPKRVWYNVNTAAFEKEGVRGSNRFKFLYGDLIEESVLYIAELAGHEVTLPQERLSMNVDGWIVTGRIDALIDGVLVDVKSMESFSYERFEKGTYEDKFGYYNQLGIYKYLLEVTRGIPIPEAGLLAVNKQNGKICYREVDPSLLVRAPAVMYDVLRNPSIYEDNPTRDTKVVSGLKCLGAGCSYCPFKFNCYESEGGLTVYAYSDGPRFVVGTDHKAPKVPDITEAYIKEAFKK